MATSHEINFCGSAFFHPNLVIRIASFVFVLRLTDISVVEPELMKTTLLQLQSWKTARRLWPMPSALLPRVRRSRQVRAKITSGTRPLSGTKARADVLKHYYQNHILYGIRCSVFTLTCGACVVWYVSARWSPGSLSSSHTLLRGTP